MSEQEKEGATGRIKVTQTPQGEAPEGIRAAWLGLVLPCYPFAGRGPRFGLVSGEPGKGGQWSVVVPQAEALDILTQSDPLAARYFHDRGFPRKDYPYFCFALDEVEIISGVELQKIIHVTEDDRGDPNR